MVANVYWWSFLVLQPNNFMCWEINFKFVVEFSFLLLLILNWQFGLNCVSGYRLSRTSLIYCQIIMWTSLSAGAKWRISWRRTSDIKPWRAPLLEKNSTSSMRRSRPRWEVCRNSCCPGVIKANWRGCTDTMFSELFWCQHSFVM